MVNITTLRKEAVPITRSPVVEKAQQALEGIESVRHMVASGMGVTVLPCTAAGADQYSQRLLTSCRFTSPAPSRVVVLAWRASFTRPEVIDVLQYTISSSQLSCIHPISRKKGR